MEPKGRNGPRREGGAGAGRAGPRAGEGSGVGPGKRFGLGFLGSGFGYWWADRVWVSFYFSFSISNSN